MVEELEVTQVKWNKIPLTGVPLLVGSLALSSDERCQGEKWVLDGNRGQLASLYSVAWFLHRHRTHTHTHIQI